MALVQGPEEGRQDLARHPRQDPGLALQHHGVGAEGAGRGRGLKPDIAAAHDGHGPARAKRALQGLCVRRRAQLEDSLQVRAGDRQADRPGACGEDQDVVGQVGSVRERQPLLVAIDPHAAH